MTEAERNLLLFGQNEPLPEQIELTAGPLTLIFEEGAIRYIKYRDHEVIRRIYAAVRDKEWRTVPGKIENLKINRREDSFDLSFTSEHDAWGIQFVWRGRIVGDAH